MQVAGRLIGEDQLGFSHDRSGDGYQLLDAAGQLAGIKRLLGGELKLIEDFRNGGLALATFQSSIGERDVEVFENCQAVEQVKLLEDEADITLVQLAALFVGTLVNGLAEKVVLPAPRAIKHPEDTEKRRFARAGRPHDGYELPFHHFQVDAAQGKVLFCTCRKVL